MDCDEVKACAVKLSYVPGESKVIEVVTTMGDSQLDLTKAIQAGETNTRIELLETEGGPRIRYYNEEYVRSEGQSGCFYDICVSDLAGYIKLNDLNDVNAPTPANGTVIMYDAAENKYKSFDLTTALASLQAQIDALNGNVSGATSSLEAILARLQSELATLKQNVESRLSAIENAIYNWSSDKSTKIPRGNINITSGGFTGSNGIFSRAKDQNNDLDFQ